MGVLAARVNHFFGRHAEFFYPRYGLLSYGAIGVIFVYEGKEVRGYGHGEPALGFFESCFFFGGEFYEFTQDFERGYPVFELPQPVRAFRVAVRLFKDMNLTVEASGQVAAWATAVRPSS